MSSFGGSQRNGRATSRPTKSSSKPTMRSLTLSLVASLLLCGCAVGPNYHPPAATAPPAFSNASDPAFTADPALADWWRGFNDPQLNALVDRALRHNHD